MRNALHALTLAALWSAVAAPAAPPADPLRIIAIGDLHGDHQAYAEVVAAAGLADAKGHWSGGTSVLVQMGDVTDRGPDSRAIIHDLRVLQREAPAHGGQVIMLVGNHEAMNVEGDLRYVDPGEYAAFRTSGSEQFRDVVYRANQDVIEKRFRIREPALTSGEIRMRWLAETPPGKMEQRKAFSPHGEIGAWLVRQPAVVRIGDSLFVHGGLSAEYAGRSLATINRAISSALAQGEGMPNPVLDDPLGPLWYRGNVRRPSPDVADEGRPDQAKELDEVLTARGARRLVVAHTPNLAGIVASDDGRLIRVDTGMSRAYGGVRAYLELRGDTAVAVEKTGAGWTRKSLPSPPPMAGATARKGQ